MKTIIYKDHSIGGIKLYAGEVISKKKTYKIKQLASNQFCGYKTLVYPDDVVAEFDTDNEYKTEEIFNLVKKSYDLLSEFDKKIIDLNKKRNEEIEEVCKSIKALEG